MIRGSDGYEYEDLTARLVGRRANTVWNQDLRACHAGPCPEDEVRAYVETYDSEYRCLAPCHGHTAAHNTALEAARNAAKRVRREYIFRIRDVVRAALAKSYADSADQALYRALIGAGPAGPSGPASITGVIVDEPAALAPSYAPAAGSAGAGGAHPGQASTHPVHPAS